MVKTTNVTIIPGRISNVEFEQGRMKTWHAYGIGGGKQMPIDHENNIYKFLQQIQKIQHFKIETR